MKNNNEEPIKKRITLDIETYKHDDIIAESIRHFCYSHGLRFSSIKILNLDS